MQIEAFAKVNLTLEITGVLDNGYHTLDTVFCWLELHDTVKLERASTTSLRMSGADEVPVDESNLALKAVRALEQAAGQSLPVAIEISKRIPAGGGLGGGSADAAAVLWGLNSFYELGLDRARLTELGVRIGADVAFGLWGGAARGRGVGERLEWVPSPPPLPVVLIFPGFPCSTPEVYRVWDRDRPRPADGATERLLDSLAQETNVALAELLANDLQPAAEELFPQLAGFRQLALDCGCGAAMLSGSGSTIFGLVADGQEPEAVVRRLQPHVEAQLTHLRPSRRNGV